MNKTKIIAEVNQIFIKQFDDPSIKITQKTEAKDIAGWDSLMHIELIVAIEKHFKIRFTSLEIQNFKNVGQMSEVIEGKLNARG